MKMKWIYPLTLKERKSYNPEDIIVVYDRGFNKYWTPAYIPIKILEPIKEP